jgi:TetR/AcrR family acrAB operon transcriptional repressor
MVRKTKEEALATRGRILDAAERVFQLQGVAATSLHHIASAAGVTRGAVYWHFKDKADLFDAMLSRVVLPMEAAAQAQLEGAGAPLARLRAHLAALFAWIEGDAQAQRVFDIITTRVEYVDELSALRERQAESCGDYLLRLRAVLDEAQRAGHVAARLPMQPLATGLFALIDGLIRNWVLDPRAYPLKTTGLLAVDNYLAGLTVPVQAATARVKPTRVTPS